MVIAIRFRSESENASISIDADNDLLNTYKHLLLAKRFSA